MSGAAMLRADANLKRRRRNETIWRGVLLFGSSLSVLALAVLLWQILKPGLPELDWQFWSTNYSPRGIRSGESGVFDSLMSSIIVLVMTLLFAVPVGTAAGIYLHEYAGQSRLTEWIRATVSNLAGVPSVVYGLLGLAVFVRLFAFGATNISSALTLGVLILPILIVSTEEALKTVPASVRHASLAVGATRWQTIRSHVLPYSLPGILTGNILALSRAAGETAPLLIIGIPIFTTVTGYLPLDGGTPLQARVFYLAQDPRSEAHALAAGAIVVLMLATLCLNLVAIFLRDRLQRRIKW